MKKVYLPLIVFLFAANTFASESTIRCDGNIVSIGDSVADLLSKCSQPMYHSDSTRRETYWVDNTLHSKTISVTKFLYSSGPGDFIREVIVEDGVVVKINTTTTRANN